VVIIFEIRRNWLRSGRSRLLYLYIYIYIYIYKKGDKTDCSKYRGKSLLSTTYKILSNILLSRLIPYAEEITGGHPCGLRSNRSTTDHKFCIRQILDKKWKHNEAVHQLFIDFLESLLFREKGGLVKYYR